MFHLEARQPFYIIVFIATFTAVPRELEITTNSKTRTARAGREIVNSRIRVERIATVL
jgi:hypothetical protein